MDQPINLSYILTTFNKLAYLKITLPALIGACQKDEEIVVVDGGSTDGTVEWLTSQKEQFNIHQFISEQDCGEAHGTNKAILLARGTLIKIITDDDVYSFTAILECKRFMMIHPEIDLLVANGFYLNPSVTKNSDAVKNNQEKSFASWLVDKKPFLFTGLGIMMRRSSLALLGLFDTNFLIVDYEYSLRVTSGKSKLAWYSGYAFVNIVNSDSNSSKYWERLQIEKDRLFKFYKLKSVFLRTNYVKWRSWVSQYVRGSIFKKPNSNEFEYVELNKKATYILIEQNKIDQGKFYFLR